MRGPILAVAVLGAATLAPASPAFAQGGPPGDPDLAAVARRIAGIWGGGELDAVASLLDSGGVQVQVPGEVGGSLAPRKARAVLGRVLEAHGTSGIEVVRASPAGGTPARGFAELRWSAVPRGTSQVLRYTLFVGLVHGSEGWRIYEIRVLTP